MANANIFAAYQQPVKSVDDWQAEDDAKALRRQQLVGAQRQNVLADLVAQQQRQTMTDSAGDRNALQAAAQASAGSTDRLIQLLRASGRAGLMQQADTMEKGQLERRNTESQIGERVATTLGKHLDALSTLSKAVMANPTPENAAGALAQWEQLTGRQDPNERAQIAQLQTPEQVMAWARAHAMKADDLKAQIFTNNTGGSTVTQSYNPVSGQLSTLGQVKNTQSPDSAASVAATIRGQNVTDKRERDLAAGKVTYQTDANGNMVALPERAAPGTVVRGRLVVGATGMQPISGKDPGLNDSQSKALLFGTRMQEADKILNELASKGTDQPGLWKRGVEGTLSIVPQWAGGDGLAAAGGALMNITQSADQQRVEQAQRDFVNAVLRRESGASISPTEFASAEKQYFPKPGDSEEVKRQKARNRALATQGLLAEVPANKRQLPGAFNGAAPKPGSVLKFDANGNLVQ